MTAYTKYADDPSFMRVIRRPAVESGPAWIDSDLYFVEAEAEGRASQATMRGSMLQALLEDRFQLKVHRETREAPVYALTVAKNGNKLHPTLAGSCTPDQIGAPNPSERPACRSYQVLPGKGLNTRTADSYGMSLDEFAKTLPMYGLDRPVINRTGIAGIFDFHLEYALGETEPVLHRDGGDLADAIAPYICDALVS